MWHGTDCKCKGKLFELILLNELCGLYVSQFWGNNIVVNKTRPKLLTPEFRIQAFDLHEIY